MSLKHLGTLLQSLAARKRAGLIAILTAAAVAALAALPGHEPATAQEKKEAPAAPKASTFSAEQKAEIQRIIKDYLVSNPEVLFEAQSALEAKMEQIQAEKMKASLAAHKAEVFHDPKSPVIGNAKGDVTVVEFFDYNCGYCKVALPSISKLVERDSKVRVVFKEVTFIGRDVSAGASRVALAARVQGKYWEVHRGLLELKGTANEAAALRIAERSGVNMEQLKKDMASPAVKQELEANHALAQKLGINGTPFFLVGDRVISGAAENLLDTMANLVADVRKKGCSVC